MLVRICVSHVYKTSVLHVHKTGVLHVYKTGVLHVFKKRVSHVYKTCVSHDFKKCVSRVCHHPRVERGPCLLSGPGTTSNQRQVPMTPTTNMTPGGRGIFCMERAIYHTNIGSSNSSVQGQSTCMTLREQKLRTKHPWDFLRLEFATYS